MNTLIHADIFFFITSIAVALLSAVLVVMFIYAVRIMRDLKHISTIARDQADSIKQDIDELRAQLKREERWGVFSPFIALAQHLGKQRKGRDHKRSSK